MQKILNKKNILVGITGSIAAYKSLELIRELRESGAEVRVVLTSAAQHFITPLLAAAVSAQQVYSDFLTDPTAPFQHIELARWADLILVAPASADFIAKLTYGFADDLLSCLCLAAGNTPLAIAPAMNQAMWENTITQQNITLLRTRNFFIWGPSPGIQACGEEGFGRMLEVEQLHQTTIDYFVTQQTPKVLQGCRLLITAGPTREFIDPVRFISNCSSGKMGYALAEAAQQAGATVALISGPTSLPLSTEIKKIAVSSAAEMYAAVMANIADCDVFMGVAAVADYHPVTVEKNKIKKKATNITLELTRTIDILASVANLPQKPWVIGFAAETENLLLNAQAKLQEKNLDWVIANHHQDGFNSDENTVTILRKNKTSLSLPKMSKVLLAREIVHMFATEWQNMRLFTSPLVG